MSINWDRFFDAGGVAGVVALGIQIGGGVRSWLGRPRLRIRPFDADRDVGDWEGVTNPYTITAPATNRRFVTLQIENPGKRVATRCVARAVVESTPPGVRLREDAFGLHWADVVDGGTSTGAVPVEIGPEGRRLDVAFTDEFQTIAGCWIALPVALVQPTRNQAHLQPGRYYVRVTVQSDNGASVSIRLCVESPMVWSELMASRA